MNDLSRRRFLQASGLFTLVGAGLGVSQTATSAGPGTNVSSSPSSPTGLPKRKFTMDLSCGMIGVKVSLPEAIRMAHQYGFESVAPVVDALGKLSDAELAELRGGMNAQGLAWGASGLPLDFRGDEGKFTAGLKGLPKWAQAAKRAGVVRINTWLTSSHASLTYMANFRQHAQRLREVAKVLGDHGLRLGLEYVGPKSSYTAQRYPFLHTMAELKDLIAEIGQHNVGFLLDSWHWYTAGESQADLLTLTNHDVVACHLNDGPLGIALDQQKDNSRELPCATGVIDLKAFLGALVTIGYDGPVSAEPFYQPLREMPPEKAVETTAAAMKKAFALVG
jgi:sugar phosphate isomerase/epimerase